MRQSTIQVDDAEQPNTVAAHNPLLEGQKITQQRCGVGRTVQIHAGDAVRPGRGWCPAQGRMDFVVIWAQHLQSQDVLELAERQDRPGFRIVGAARHDIGRR
jgi:hypothetical protein